MNETVLILLPFFIIFGIWVYRLGKRHGIRVERCRVQDIFISSFSAISGGSISILWQCVLGNTTIEEMRNDLISNLRKRDLKLKENQ